MSQTPIKVAVVGVGNLTSALVQATEYYKNNPDQEIVNTNIGGLRVKDIQVVAAFDIDKRKVNHPLNEAIFTPPNNMRKLIEVPPMGVIVNMGIVADGISEYTEGVIQPSEEDPVDVSSVLKSSSAEILLLNTPSGSHEANRYYVNEAIKAKVAVINSTPSKIVRDQEFVKQFSEEGIPVIGDDLQSQVGGTVFHKGVLEILHEQGVIVEDTYQLDVSGGLEGLTTLDYDRRTLKRKTKEDSIKRSLPYESNVAAGTTDYLDFLGSQRIGHYWIKGVGFMGHQIKMDITVNTDDGANGAASLVDAIRATKLALNRGMGGPITSICAHLYKAPPHYMSRTEASDRFNEFIHGK